MYITNHNNNNNARWSLKIMTVTEAARMRGCTVKYIYDLLRAGRLPGAVKKGKVWMIPASAVKAKTQ
jgi:excisionase family DNA binding protein